MTASSLSDPFTQLRREGAVFATRRLASARSCSSGVLPAGTLPKCGQPELPSGSRQIDLLRDADGVLLRLSGSFGKELGHLPALRMYSFRVVDHLEPVGSVDGSPALMRP